MKKQVVVGILKYALGLGLLGYVVWRYWDSSDGNPGLKEAFSTREVDLVPLLLAAIVYLAGMLLTFYRWFILVRAQNLPFTVMAAMRLGLIGFYLSTFLPGSVGGDVIKAAFIAREQSRRTVAIATVIIDRVIGLAGLFWLVAIVGGVAWLGGFMDEITLDGAGAGQLETITTAGIGLVFASFAGWFAAGYVTPEAAGRFATKLASVPKIGGPLAELWRALYIYRRQGKSVTAALGLSMVGHVAFVLAFYFAALTLSRENQVPSMPVHFLLVPVGMTVEAGFPAPGGVGGAEFFYGELYKIVGYPAANGVLASLVKRVITWALGLAGYLIYLRMKPALRPVQRSPAELAAGAVVSEGVPGP